MEKEPMTPYGKLQLENELRHLLQVERHNIIKDIEEARAHGDISENSEFEDAKERQAMCEARIRDLESKLSRAQVVDISRREPDDKVIFGAKVNFISYDAKTDVEVEYDYQIVGVDEADTQQGKISYRSPIGQALLGKRVGEEVEVRTPSGARLLSVEDVRYTADDSSEDSSDDSSDDSE